MQEKGFGYRPQFHDAASLMTPQSGHPNRSKHAPTKALGKTPFLCQKNWGARHHQSPHTGIWRAQKNSAFIHRQRIFCLKGCQVP